MTESLKSFARLSAINVNDHVEKKGGFSYLSWPYAVAQLRTADPAAVWEVRRFGGLPYLATEAGVFVEVAVTVQGVTLSQIHPVLDGRNRPLISPTAFDINSSIQRCLVKAIALHGLGLYIYAGEDLPQPVGVEAAAANDDRGNDEGESGDRLRDDAPGRGQGRHAPTISRSQQAQLHRLVIETGVDLQHMLDYFCVRSLADITPTLFPRVLRSLEKRRTSA
jgi:hypothetical protein